MTEEQATLQPAKQNQHYENFKDFNEMAHRHLLSTTDKLSEYGQICAKEFRETFQVVNQGCNATIKELGTIITDNHDLVVPLAKTISMTAIAGIAGATAILLMKESGYKEKYDPKSGKTKITYR